MRPGDHIEFFAEIDLLGALSACPGGDCSAEHSTDAAACHPLLVEIFVARRRADGWAPPRSERLRPQPRPTAALGAPRDPLSGEGGFQRDLHHVAETLSRGPRRASASSVSRWSRHGQDRQRAHAVARGEVVEFGRLHLDAEDPVPGHLLVQVRTFVVEDVGRIDSADMR